MNDAIQKLILVSGVVMITVTGFFHSFLLGNIERKLISIDNHLTQQCS